LALLILFLGVTAFRSMPEDIFPEIDIPVVMSSGNTRPQHAGEEQRVTTYGEYAMSTNVGGIKDMEAQTLDGISVPKIFFSRTSISISRSRKSSRPPIIFAC